MPTPHIGAEAITPVISATGRIQGNSAIPVYVYTSIPADRRGLGMAAQPVVFITDSDLVENGGQYKLEGRLTALPVIQVAAGSQLLGMAAIAVYDVTNKDWPPLFSPVGIPSAPTNLVATAISSSEIDLTWAALGGQASYKLERKTGAGGTYAQIATPAAGATTYPDMGLSASTTYYYRIRATNSAGDSGYSNEANATTSGVFAGVPWAAQWKFNNNGNDSIGTNNLTAVNSPTFTTGILGGATGATLLVAASSQNWSVADNATLRPTADISILAWVYLTSKTSGTIIAKGSANEYELLYNSTTDRFRVSLDGAAHYLTADTFGAPSIGAWYCVMAWFDSATGTQYISVNNGAADSQTGLTEAPGTAAVTIGQRGSSTLYWDGRIDNVCIATSAVGGGGVLTPAQRTAFYNGGAGTEAIT